MVAVTVLFLILMNQNVFAQSSRKTSKILNAACIYKPNTTFLFKAVYDSLGSIKTEYILMRILPDIYAGEIIILYNYYNDVPEIFNGDSIVNVENTIWKRPEETIITDNKKYIQLHPPRSGKYYLSQYFPFPNIKLPVKEGKKSKWGIVGNNNPLTTRKFSFLKYKMQNSPKFQYQYKDSLIEVYEKKGKAISRIGEHAASYLFNEELGFVKWRISSSNNVSLEFTLIDTYPFLLKNHIQTDNYIFFAKKSRAKS
jgi:hypothetical protein